MIHTCTRCELRFPTEAELREHLVVDHDVDPTPLEHGYPAERSTFRPLYAGIPAEQRAGERRYLVVANRTLGGEALRARIAEAVAAGGARFHVVVPSATDEAALGQARFRLRHAIDELQAAGAEATGEVGPADPFQAVAEVLARDEFDEVVLSTLPASASRWLGLDLPARIERNFRVPVTTVTAAG